MATEICQKFPELRSPRLDFNISKSGGGGYGGTVKFKADFGVEPEPDKGLSAVTHQAPPELLR